MFRPGISLISAALAITGTISGVFVAAEPPPPLVTYLYSVKLLMPPTVEIGQVPYGSRGIIPISGGSFTGPKLNGIVGIGLDWGLTDSLQGCLLARRDLRAQHARQRHHHGHGKGPRPACSHPL